MESFLDPNFYPLVIEFFDLLSYSSHTRTNTLKIDTKAKAAVGGNGSFQSCSREWERMTYLGEEFVWGELEEEEVTTTTFKVKGVELLKQSARI